MNFSISQFLNKLQNLSDKNKKIILWTVVAVLAIIMGFFWIKSVGDKLNSISKNAGQIKLPQIEMPIVEIPTDQTADWKIFKFNSYGGFEIKYPEDWTFRQYDSGATFFPKNQSAENTTGNGIINVGFYDRGINYCKIPFEDYVKIAGPSEIQNYESLNTIKNNININGVVAYTATWNYIDMTGDKKISLPITYFGTPNNQLCGSFDVFLNDSNYSDIYNKMISTFKFIEK